MPREFGLLNAPFFRMCSLETPIVIGFQKMGAGERMFSGSIDIFFYKNLRMRFLGAEIP